MENIASLNSLSVDDVIILFENLNIPHSSDIVTKNLIDGNTLWCIEEITELSELGFTLPVAKARFLYNTIHTFKINGIVKDKYLTKSSKSVPVDSVGNETEFLEEAVGKNSELRQSSPVFDIVKSSLVSSLQSNVSVKSVDRLEDRFPILSDILDGPDSLSSSNQLPEFRESSEHRPRSNFGSGLAEGSFIKITQSPMSSSNGLPITQEDSPILNNSTIITTTTPIAETIYSDCPLPQISQFLPEDITNKTPSIPPLDNHLAVGNVGSNEIATRGSTEESLPSRKDITQQPANLPPLPSVVLLGPSDALTRLKKEFDRKLDDLVTAVPSLPPPFPLSPSLTEGNDDRSRAEKRAQPIRVTMGSVNGSITAITCNNDNIDSNASSLSASPVTTILTSSSVPEPATHRDTDRPSEGLEIERDLDKKKRISEPSEWLQSSTGKPSELPRGVPRTASYPLASAETDSSVGESLVSPSIPSNRPLDPPLTDAIQPPLVSENGPVAPSEALPQSGSLTSEERDIYPPEQTAVSPATESVPGPSHESESDYNTDLSSLLSQQPPIDHPENTSRPPSLAQPSTLTADSNRIKPLGSAQQEQPTAVSPLTREPGLEIAWTVSNEFQGQRPEGEGVVVEGLRKEMSFEDVMRNLPVFDVRIRVLDEMDQIEEGLLEQQMQRKQITAANSEAESGGGAVDSQPHLPTIVHESTSPDVPAFSPLPALSDDDATVPRDSSEASSYHKNGTGDTEKTAFETEGHIVKQSVEAEVAGVDAGQLAQQLESRFGSLRDAMAVMNLDRLPTTTIPTTSLPDHVTYPNQSTTDSSEGGGQEGVSREIAPMADSQSLPSSFPVTPSALLSSPTRDNDASDGVTLAADHPFTATDSKIISPTNHIAESPSQPVQHTDITNAPASTSDSNDASDPAIGGGSGVALTGTPTTTQSLEVVRVATVAPQIVQFTTPPQSVVGAELTPGSEPSQQIQPESVSTARSTITTDPVKEVSLESVSSCNGRTDGNNDQPPSPSTLARLLTLSPDSRGSNSGFTSNRKNIIVESSPENLTTSKLQSFASESPISPSSSRHGFSNHGSNRVLDLAPLRSINKSILLGTSEETTPPPTSFWTLENQGMDSTTSKFEPDIQTSRETTRIEDQHRLEGVKPVDQNILGVDDTPQDGGIAMSDQANATERIANSVLEIATHTQAHKNEANVRHGAIPTQPLHEDGSSTEVAAEGAPPQLDAKGSPSRSSAVEHRTSDAQRGGSTGSGVGVLSVSVLPLELETLLEKIQRAVLCIDDVTHTEELFIEMINVVQGVEDNLSQIRRTPAIELSLITIIKHHIQHSNICEHGCRLMNFLLAENDDMIMRFGAAGACEIINSILTSRVSVAAIAEVACYVVKHLAAYNDSENTLRLGANGTCKLVVAALKIHLNDVAVSKAACYSILNLAYHAENRIKLGAAGACEVVVSALNAHTLVAGVAEPACWSIFNLAFRCRKLSTLIYDENKNRLGTVGACEAVVSALRVQILVQAVALAGCKAVCILAYRHTENKLKLGKAGACDFVLAALGAHSSDPLIAEWGCRALSNLAVNSKENSNSLGSGGACKAVILSLHNHICSISAIEAACRAISNLSDNNEKNAMRLCQAGACEAIVKAMKWHSVVHVGVAEWGCRSVLNLSLNIDENKVLLGDAGACEAVVIAIKAHGNSSSVVDWGWKAVCALTVNNQENNSRLAAAGAFQLIVDVLATHIAAKQVIEWGCWVVSCLAANTPMSGRHFSSTGAYEKVVEFLWTRISTPTAAEAGCRAISNLAENSETGVTKLCEVGAVEAVTHALTLHPTATGLVEWSYRAIWNLASKSGDVKSKLGATGGCDALVVSLKVHISNSMIADWGCRVVCILAFDETNRSKLGEAGACAVVVSVLRIHSAIITVLEAACLALFNLCFHPFNKDMLRQAGACDAITLSLARHASSGVLAMQACCAVNILASNCQDSKVAFGVAGACEAVVLALRTHSKDPNVCEAACGAVLCLGGNAENNSRLGNAGACEIVVLILQTNLSKSKVSEAALRALAVLANDKENCRKCGAIGACEVCLEMLRCNRRSSSVIETTCLTIYALTATSSNKHKFMQGDVKPLLSSILDDPIISNEAKKQAKFALEVFLWFVFW